MQYLKKFFIWVIVLVLIGGLSFLFSAVLFHQTVADKSVVKSWVVESGVYDNIIDDVIASSTATSSDTEQSIDSAILQKAANEAFTPALLQDTTESVLDGLYDWLEGTEETIAFKLDFTEAKNTFSNSLSRQARIRVESLPKCTQSELAALDSVDIFSLTCAPPATVYNPVIEDIQQQALSSDQFLEDPIIEAADINFPIAGEQKTLDQAFPFAPNVWFILKRSVLLSLGLIVLALCLLLLITHSKLITFRKVAKALRSAAISLALLGGSLLLFTYSTGDSGLVNSLSQIIIADVLFIVAVFIGVYIILSLCCYVAYRTLLKRERQNQPVT